MGCLKLQWVVVGRVHASLPADNPLLLSAGFGGQDACPSP
jgi:hypothetical protein